jgi:hypothetical protein
MKRIILDHFQRRWFMWAAFCMVNFIMGLLLINLGETVPSFFYMVLAFILGPNLWLSELQKGYPRVVLGLPLTAQQIGRTLWWLSVGFASMLLVGFSLLGIISARLFSLTNNLSFGAWMLYVFINAFLYGTVFWLFSGASSHPSDNWRKKTGAYFYSVAMWVLVIGGIYFFSKDVYPTAIKLTAFFLVCGTLSILGWFRAEGLIVEYGEHRAASQQPKNSHGQFKAPNGFGGIPFIFGTAFFRVWGMGIILLIVMNLVGLFTKHQFNWHHLTQGFSNGNAFPFFFIFMILSFALSDNLRFLRTMPVSSARLAATLLSVYILPLLTVCLAITALAWAETGAVECVSFFKLELLAVSPVSVFVAVSIWNTDGNFIKTILLVILIVAAFAPAFYQLTCMFSRGLPFWFIILFNIVIVSISYWSTCQIIAKSSSAYLARQNQLGNRWSWGR